MPATPSSSEPIPLDYAAAPSRWRKRSGRILLVLILLVTAFCGWRWGPYAWHQSQILYWQRQCVNYSVSADAVAYEEDPAAAAVLLRQSSDHSSRILKRGSDPGDHPTPVQAAAFEPRCWRTLRSLASLPKDSLFYETGGAAAAIVFLHERTSPAGHRRLVCVDYAPGTTTFQPAFIGGYNYDACVAPPATWTKPLVAVEHGYELDVPSGYPRHPPLVRVYAGQPDANDQSHFTIRYQMWGQEDVLDGWLGDDDEVRLVPRHLPEWPKN